MGPHILVRKYDPATFVGDAWAATGSQAEPDQGLELVCTSSPVRFVAVGFDGVLDSSQAVTDTVATVDARLVKRADLGRGDGSAMTVPTSDGGAPARRLGEELTEVDISPGQRFWVGFLAATGGGPAVEVRVYVLAGARELGSGS